MGQGGGGYAKWRQANQLTCHVKLYSQKPRKETIHKSNKAPID